MENNRHRALEKLQVEVEKDINRMIDLAKESTVSELYFLIYLLKLVRIIRNNPNSYSIHRPEYIKAVTPLLEDAIKYAIQLAYKYGNKPAELDESQIPQLNHPLAIALHKTASLLNSKFELNALFQLFEVDLQGENGRHVAIDMSAVRNNPEVKKFFDYFLRIDLDNTHYQQRLQTKKELFDGFYSEFSAVSHLFKSEFGLSIDDFVRFYDYMIQSISRKLSMFEKVAPKLANGNIAETHPHTISLFTPHIMLTEEEITKVLGNKVIQLIQRLTLSPDDINDGELHYHLLARKPLLRAVTGELIVSPEIFLDSLFTNTHYSFLEGKMHEQYKSITSEVFLKRIVVVARKYGYKVVRENLDLYIGKQQIGDLDLVLKNNKGHTLLIEAKKYALPLNVYFKDVVATNARLTSLQKDWGNKVRRRLEHLRDNFASYGLQEPYTYIIVSLNPEILSHYSDILCISLGELDAYLSKGDPDISFNEIFEARYSGSHLTQEEMQLIQEDGLSVLTFK